MKRLFYACLLIYACSSTMGAVTIWQEDFGCYTNSGITGQGSVNYPAGITNWSIDVRACTTLNPGSGSSNDCFMAVATSGGRMEAAHIVGEAVWSSAVINISDYTNISLSATTSETGSSTSTNKYVKLFYRLNSGSETAFAVNPSSIGNWGSATAAQSNLYGSTVQIIARVNNPNAGDKSIFDSVIVSGDRIVVHVPPVLDTIGNKAVVAGEILSFTVTGSDPAGNYSVTLAASNLPVGAVFTNGVFMWSNAAPIGAYAVTFFATDNDGFDSKTITITVTEPAFVSSHIAGKFYGWSGDTIFKLENGQFWQQSVSGVKTFPVMNRPAIIITNVYGQRRMYISNDYVLVASLTVTESSSAYSLSGLHNQNIYQLTDGTAWKQISFENIVTSASPVTVWRWIKSGQQLLRFLDRNNVVLGTCTAAALAGYSESSITNTFIGLHYGNMYQLASGQGWMQVSFENVRTNVASPKVMLWADGLQTNLLVRDSLGMTIGTCTVVDPDTDSDRDGFSNSAEVLAGFDPLDSQSRFELRQTDRCVLSWSAVEGRVYTIGWAPSLTESFQPLGTGIVWPQNSWTDTIHSAEAKGYYRITVRLAE